MTSCLNVMSLSILYCHDILSHLAMVYFLVLSRILQSGVTMHIQFWDWKVTQKWLTSLFMQSTQTFTLTHMSSLLKISDMHLYNRREIINVLHLILILVTTFQPSIFLPSACMQLCGQVSTGLLWKNPACTILSNLHIVVRRLQPLIAVMVTYDSCDHLMHNIHGNSVNVT